MARDAQEVHPRRQRLHNLLFRRSMFFVLHRQDLFRFGSLWEEDKLGKVRCRNLHFLYVLQVRITLPRPSRSFADDNSRHLELTITPPPILPRLGRLFY